jgi:crossover junction endodeoxyribonuclease RusA
MGDQVHIRVTGRPAPQGSKRHVGGGRMIEQSKAVGPWREAIRAEVQRSGMTMIDGAASVSITFILPRPRSHYGTGRNAGVLAARAPRYPSGKPDIDKLARAVLDGLTMGGAFADDAQVVTLNAGKVYGLLGDASGCDIWIGAEHG